MTLPQRVAEQFMKDTAEHAKMMKADPYYAHCYGGGRIPEPCCKYCMEYDGNHCMKEWNNLDPVFYIDWRDDKEPDQVCDDYEWNGEWEDC